MIIIIFSIKAWSLLDIYCVNSFVATAAIHIGEDREMKIQSVLKIVAACVITLYINSASATIIKAFTDWKKLAGYSLIAAMASYPNTPLKLFAIEVMPELRKAGSSRLVKSLANRLKLEPACSKPIQNRAAKRNRRMIWKN